VVQKGLENRRPCKRPVGSNPTPSAIRINMLDVMPWRLAVRICAGPPSNGGPYRDRFTYLPRPVRVGRSTGGGATSPVGPVCYLR